jgi:hypothetical protein
MLLSGMTRSVTLLISLSAAVNGTSESIPEMQNAVYVNAWIGLLCCGKVLLDQKEVFCRWEYQGSAVYIAANGRRQVIEQLFRY